MKAGDVIRVIGRLEAAGVDVHLSGGWSIDALVGRATRVHDDLDLWLPAHQFHLAVRALAELGIDRLAPRGDDRPWNFVLGDDQGRIVDLHVYEPIGDGSELHYGPYESGHRFPAEALTGSGTVDGRPVRCESPQWALRWHTGYTIRDKDRHDVALLCEVFDLPRPEGFDRA